MHNLVDIILPLAIADVYTYRIPPTMSMPPVGVRVIVPLGKKTITGLCYRPHHEALSADIKVRDVIDVLDETPIVTAAQLQQWEWIAHYYMCTLGEVMTAALPAGIIDGDYKQLTTQYVQLSAAYQTPERFAELSTLLRRAKVQQKVLDAYAALVPSLDQSVSNRELLETSGVGSAILRTMITKGIFTEEERVVSRLRQYSGVVKEAHALDAQQSNAMNAIRQVWKDKPVCLLHGVTSSGKTEVYIHCIQQALREGKQVLYLVPEIALTTQLTDRLQSVFGDQVLVYHSRFSNEERVEVYHEVRGVSRNEAANGGRLILGARSAVFLPFSNLGLVIVDEEHEPSYKQQDPAPRYHARSVAIMMSQWYGANILLGTATPSVDSYYNALQGKYGLVEMKERYQGLQLPRITLVDLQRQYHRKEMYGHFADPVVFRIREEIARGKQVILFQNRRGYAPFLQCPQCGEVPKCPNCDVSMTYHKSTATMVCHSCGHAAAAPTTCPKCGAGWQLHGLGTERLEEEIQQLFPAARVARMDLDSTRRKDAYQQIIDRFARHEVDILIGTQMVTKGLHFDDVSLVVVLQADMLVNRPDFRATEHAFHMLEQVAGRAGRTGERGEVMIQTFNPQNPLYAQLCAHDYASLYAQQVSERQLFGFPPYTRLIKVALRHRDVQKLNSAANAVLNNLRNVFGKRVSSLISPAVSRVNNLYVLELRLRIEVTTNFALAKKLLRDGIHAALAHTQCKSVIVMIDVDPQ